MDKDKAKLKEACYLVARTTMWDRKPVDTDDIESHAEKLFKEALLQYDLVSELGGSIPMVTRAVHYLEQAHAIPPMKNDIYWFSDALRTLLEVACPNSGLKGQAREFLLDMENGISSFILD
ncbi:MAG: hypothetical protein RPV21_15710 [Candidatus Sedimenticola sp. (ex Thyasira tokunagai)]